jgi:hypothetical protein
MNDSEHRLAPSPDRYASIASSVWERSLYHRCLACLGVGAANGNQDWVGRRCSPNLGQTHWYTAGRNDLSRRFVAAGMVVMVWTIWPSIAVLLRQRDADAA